VVKMLQLKLGQPEPSRIESGRKIKLSLAARLPRQ